MIAVGPRPGVRQRRLGQNFLADPNLLDAIVRDAGVEAGDVVLEVGGGDGALSERLAPHVAHLHVVELDRRLEGGLGPLAERLGNITLHWADAMKLELGELDPAPGAVVSNLPYSIATPLILRTIAELPDVRSWTLLVQREIAERLRAAPGGPEYGGPSVLVQLACDVELLRVVDRAVFVPRPRVDSALVRLQRKGPAVPPEVARIVRGAFSHRRKTLAGSLELAGEATREQVREVLSAIGLEADARAQALAPEELERLARSLAGSSPAGPERNRPGGPAPR